MLSSIAPTVLIDTAGTGGRFFPVQEQLADITGTRDALEALHDEYDRRVAELKARHPDMWPALDWVYFDEYEAGANVYVSNLNDSLPGFRVLSDLGAPLPGCDPP